MNILLTGANGFLGKILKNELNNDTIITLGRENNDYNLDLRYDIPTINHNIDLIIHCSGKAHISPKRYDEKQDFYNVNTQGTINLLKGINILSCKPSHFILISTVAVYGKNKGENISEDTPLNALDPYGHSKILAEKEVLVWGAEKNIPVTILRLPLLAGDYPKGNLKKMIEAIIKGYYFRVGSGKQRKSILVGKDIASIIPKILSNGGVYNLTDDYNPSLRELETVIMKKYNKRNIISLPYTLALLLSKMGDVINIILRRQISPLNSDTLNKITSTLTFSCEKAKKELGWLPKKATDFFLE